MIVSRSRLITFAKVAASVACFALVWRMFVPTNWGELLKSLDLRLGLAAVAVLLVGQVANGYRHWAVLLGLGRRIGAGTVVALTCAGMFFNQVLPSGLGGDVVRVLNLRRSCGWKRATASVLLDRIAGVSFNLALVALLLPVYLRLEIAASAKAAIALVSVGSLVGLAGGILVARWRRLRRLWPRPLRLVPYGLMLLARLARPRILLRLLPPVAIGFFCFVAAFALLGEGLDGHVSLVGYLMMVPLIFIAAQFPLSFGGWGIREGAAVGLMPLVGMDPGVAFLTSFLFGVAVLVTSLPGLVVWAVFGFDRPAPESASLTASSTR